MLSGINTEEVKQQVMDAATEKFGDADIEAFFEHGQWFICVDDLSHHLDDANYYSVIDCVTENGVRYLDFEEV